MQSPAAVGTEHGADVLASGQGQWEPTNHSDLWVPLQRMPGLLYSHFPNLSCHPVTQTAVFTHKKCLDSQKHKCVRRGKD